MKRRATAWSLVAALLGCAHVQAPPPGPRQVIRFPAVVITGNPHDPLAGLGDQQLLARGEASFKAKNFKDAAAAFDRLVAAYPGSPEVQGALYDAGLAWAHLGNYEISFERFQAVIQRDPSGKDGLDASFRAAEALYALGRFDQAAGLLQQIERRPGLDAPERAEATVKRGICLFDAGQLDPAERELREALRQYRQGGLLGEVDVYFPSQAWFYLGEIYRRYFMEIKFDPNGESEEKLQRDLETKAELLLTAQGHYLRCIRLGDPEWATASGFRVGELYQQLYEALVGAPVPRQLDAEEQAAYRKTLARRLRVLVQKAVEVYDRTLDAADRTGAHNPFVARARASLTRLKNLVIDGQSPAGPVKEAPPPPPPPPGLRPPS